MRRRELLIKGGFLKRKMKLKGGSDKKITFIKQEEPGAKIREVISCYAFREFPACGIPGTVLIEVLQEVQDQVLLQTDINEDKAVAQ